MKKNILIVGGAGYVGGYLTDLLIQEKYNVTVYDNLLYEDRFLKDVNFIYGDIRDAQKLSKILDKNDVVIWLAGIVGDGACAANPTLTQEINFTCVKWLVDTYKGKIIFPSTCSVYGINNSLIDESAEPNPLSLYASSKLEAEQYIIDNHNDYLIFRLGTLFGLSDRFSRIRLDLVVNVLTLKASRGEKLTVFGGEQWRPLLHVKDVATAIEYGLYKEIKGLYNLSMANYKITDLADCISKHFKQIEVEKVDMKFEDLRNYRVKDYKYKQLGWVPKFSLNDGIVEIKTIAEQNRLKNSADKIYYNAQFIKEKYGTCN